MNQNLGVNRMDLTDSSETSIFVANQIFFIFCVKIKIYTGVNATSMVKGFVKLDFIHY